MKTMPYKVKAQFTGANGSCSFKHGELYLLEVVEFDNGYIRVEGISPVAAYCDYGSFQAFLKNWMRVNLV